MTINRIDKKELKKIGRPGIKAEDLPPVGTPSILRASWKFAKDTAERFSQELGTDRTAEFLKNLVKRFE